MSGYEALEDLRGAAAAAALSLPEIVLPKTQYVTANGLRVHYLDWGGPARTDMVLLHGGALTAHTWDLVCLSLRPRCRCIAPDLRGHGNTSWSTDGLYRLADYSSDVAGLVQAVGLERFVLVGMSLGGLAAMLFAAEHPERIAGLVLVDVGPEMSGRGGERLRNFNTGAPELESVEAFVERAMAFNPRRRPELLRRWLLHSLRPTPAGTWTWKYDPERNAGIREDPGRRPDVLWAAVRRIDHPTLVVRGAESDLFLEPDAERLVAALARASYVRIDGASHTVQGDQPGPLAAAIGRFVDTLTGV